MKVWEEQNMKKWIAFLICVMLVAFAAVSPAEESEGMIALHAKVPSDWSFPCVWAWNEAGENAFSAWPGEMMEPDAANNGWYYIYIPASMENVIVNANDGSVQTDAVSVNGQNAWITVSEDKTASVSFDALTENAIPAYAERFTVYAKVDASWQEPCIWAWVDPAGTNAFPAWPGRTMKPAENGWYSAMVPVWCNSIIINANAGSVQTADIKDLDPASLWVSVSANASAEVTYEDPTAPVAEDITVCVQVPEDWTEPCLWAWSHPDGTNAFASWPGQALNKGEDGWYTLTVPGWINSVIVNANAGTVQTADLRVEAEKDLFITVSDAENVTVAYEKTN